MKILNKKINTNATFSHNKKYNCELERDILMLLDIFENIYYTQKDRRDSAPQKVAQDVRALSFSKFGKAIIANYEYAMTEPDEWQEYLADCKMAVALEGISLDDVDADIIKTVSTICIDMNQETKYSPTINGFNKYLKNEEGDYPSIYNVFIPINTVNKNVNIKCSLFIGLYLLLMDTKTLSLVIHKLPLL